MHTVTAGRVDAPGITLWQLVRGGRSFGVISVRDLHGVTTEPPSGMLWLRDSDDASLEKGADHEGQTRWAWAEGLAFELKVEGLSWRYRAAEIEPVDMVSSRLTLEVPGDGVVKLSSQGAVTQGNESGRFVVDITARGMLDTYGRLQAMTAQYDVDVSLQQVPIDAMSRFAAGRHYDNAGLAYVLGSPERVSAILGGRWLALDIDASGQLNQINATFRVHTDLFDGDLVLVRDEQGLSASPASDLHWEMTPQALVALFPQSTLTMSKSVIFTCPQPELVMPRSGAGFDLDNIQLRAVLRADDWELTDAEGQAITLRDLRIGVGAEQLGIEATAAIESLVTVASADAEVPVEQAFVASLKLADAFSESPSLEMRSRELPVELADALFGYDGVMVLLLGRALDLDAVVTIDRHAQPLGLATTRYRYELASSSDRLSGLVLGKWRGVWLQPGPGTTSRSRVSFRLRCLLG